MHTEYINQLTTMWMTGEEPMHTQEELKNYRDDEDGWTEDDAREEEVQANYVTDAKMGL